MLSVMILAYKKVNGAKSLFLTVNQTIINFYSLNSFGINSPIFASATPITSSAAP